MLNPDLLPSLLLKINESQLAIEAAILEPSYRVEQLGSAEVAENVRSSLVAFDQNKQRSSFSEAFLIC